MSTECLTHHVFIYSQEIYEIKEKWSKLQQIMYVIPEQLQLQSITILYNISNSNKDTMFSLITMYLYGYIVGSHLGGLVLTLEGASLTPRATVTIGGLPCRDLQGTSTQLTCVTPPSTSNVV